MAKTGAGTVGRLFWIINGGESKFGSNRWNGLGGEGSGEAKVCNSRFKLSCAEGNKYSKASSEFLSLICCVTTTSAQFLQPDPPMSTEDNSGLFLKSQRINTEREKKERATRLVSPMVVLFFF